MDRLASARNLLPWRKKEQERKQLPNIAPRQDSSEQGFVISDRTRPTLDYRAKEPSDASLHAVNMHGSCDSFLPPEELDIAFISDNPRSSAGSRTLATREQSDNFEDELALIEQSVSNTVLPVKPARRATLKY